MARRYSPSLTYRRSDSFVSFVLSVLLHGGIVVLLVYGWYLFQGPPVPAPTLAIEATPVNARSVRGLLRQLPQPHPTPPPPLPKPKSPPQPTPQEIAQQEAQKEQAAQEQKQAEELRQRQAQEKLAQEQAAAQAHAEELREEAEAAAQKKAEEEAAAAAAKKKQEEEEAAAKKALQERLAEEEKKEEQEQAAKDLAQREADLKRSLAEEEQQDKLAQLRASSEEASWASAITARIHRAWIPPPTVHPGIQCVLYVTQDRSGQVSSVRIGSCNGDQAVRQSIEAAVYRASPLPGPPDPSLFQSNLTITFRPDASNP